jgi:hypothetical protein
MAAGLHPMLLSRAPKLFVLVTSSHSSNPNSLFLQQLANIQHDLQILQHRRCHCFVGRDIRDCHSKVSTMF